MHHRAPRRPLSAALRTALTGHRPRHRVRGARNSRPLLAARRSSPAWRLVIPGQATAAPQPAALQRARRSPPRRRPRPRGCRRGRPDDRCGRPDVDDRRAGRDAGHEGTEVPRRGLHPGAAGGAQGPTRRPPRAKAPQPVQAAQPNPDCTLSVPADPRARRASARRTS